jgi:hypothetical protein
VLQRRLGCRVQFVCTRRRLIPGNDDRSSLLQGAFICTQAPHCFTLLSGGADQGPFATVYAYNSLTKYALLYINRQNILFLFFFYELYCTLQLRKMKRSTRVESAGPAVPEKPNQRQD